jgi:hypothetical protein
MAAAWLLVLSSMIVPGVGRTLAASDGGRVAFPPSRLTLRVPPGWRAFHYTIAGSEGILLGFVANVPLRDPCKRYANGSFDCHEAIRSLPRHSVLVSLWYEGGLFSFWSTGGRQLVLGGHRAKVLRLKPPGRAADCPARADVGIRVWIVARGPDNPSAPFDNRYQIFACLRGPGLVEAQTRVWTLLRSIRFGAYRPYFIRAAAAQAPARRSGRTAGPAH